MTRFASFALTNCDTEGNFPPVPDDVITDYLEPILGSREGTRFMEKLLVSMTPDQLAEIRPQLSRCQVATVLVWGTGDIFFRLEWAHWLQRLIPGVTEIVEVPGGRACSMWTNGPRN